jgi:hypothetical protein
MVREAVSDVVRKRRLDDAKTKEMDKILKGSLDKVASQLLMILNATIKDQLDVFAN